MKLEREVRLAVVMYGGVSLAIYINGVAQELLRLVRATAPDPTHRDRPLRDEVKGSERIYRELGRRLTADGYDATSLDPPIRTRFVVDVLSGTSAGGINAVFLAKALANGQEIEQLKSLWIERGDIELLINDRESVKGVDGLQLQPQIKSLLNSQRMYRELIDAFDYMDTDQPNAGAAQAPLVEKLDLFVTATDIKGIPVQLRLADRVVEERRHRNVLQFRYSRLDTEAHRNDFQSADNPFLAFACRCTSAFPFAFEPMRLTDVDAVLRSLPHGRARSGTADDTRWRNFFPEYRWRAASPTDNSEAYDYRARPFGDGGYLDNKPFTYAVEALTSRQAGVAVDRKLIYIEPSPETFTPDKLDSGPNAFENVAAALSLARYETIREDLERIVKRNRLIERVERILAGMEDDVKAANLGPPRSAEDFDQIDLRTMIEIHGVGYGGYHRLKVAVLTDEITGMIASAAGFDPESDEFLAIRYFVRIWRDRRYAAYPEPGGLLETQNRFINQYDLVYRLRRLGFVLRRIDLLACLDRQAATTLENIGLAVPAGERERTAFRETLADLRSELSRAHAILRTKDDELHQSGPDNPLAGPLTETGIGMDSLRLVLREPTEDKRRKCAESIIRRQEYDELLRRLATEIADQIDDASNRARRICHAALGDAAAQPDGDSARAAARHYYHHFDRYDLISFPILHSTEVGEEIDPIEVIRISPKDAPALIDELNSRRRKLAGTVLMNFGAFLAKNWRENDLLWGRLDAAERIVTMLLPSPDERQHRDELIKAAQIEILKEVLVPADADELCRLLSDAVGKKARDGAELRKLLDPPEGRNVNDRVTAALRANLTGEELHRFFRESYEVNREIDPGMAVRTMARATAVTGRVMENVADDYRMSTRTGSWVVRLGRIFWGLVEVAVPRSVPALMFRHIVSLLYAFEVFMVFGGLLLGAGTVLRFGIVALVVTVAVHLVIVLLRDFMRRRAGLLRTAVGLLVLTVIVLAGLGAFATWRAYAQWRAGEPLWLRPTTTISAQSTFHTRSSC